MPNVLETRSAFNQVIPDPNTYLALSIHPHDPACARCGLSGCDGSCEPIRELVVVPDDEHAPTLSPGDAYKVALENRRVAHFRLAAAEEAHIDARIAAEEADMVAMRAGRIYRAAQAQTAQSSDAA